MLTHRQLEWHDMGLLWCMPVVLNACTVCVDYQSESDMRWGRDGDAHL
jgi:hypothetical protein